MKNVMLHVHNACVLGGVPAFIVDLVAAFPQFFHIALYVKDQEERSAVQMLNDCGVHTAHGHASSKVFRQYDPTIIVLHDIGGKDLDGDRKWLKAWPTIFWHHSPVRPFVDADLHIFVSNHLKSKYENLIKSKAIRRWKIIPPCIQTAKFSGVFPSKHRVIGKTVDPTSAEKHSLVLKRVAELTGSKLVCNAPPWHKIPQYMSQLRVFVQVNGRRCIPTETWVRSVTEAMAAGVPVVAEDRGSNREQIQDQKTGFLVPPEDTYLVKARVEELLDNPDKAKEIGEAGRKWARNNADISVVQKELSADLLSFLLNSPIHKTDRISAQVGEEKKAAQIQVSTKSKPTLPKGVVVGCGSELEWMLKWWWKGYSKHNSYPVLFVDMGMGKEAMSAEARRWCAERGTVKTLCMPLTGWFQKPFAFMQTIFEESVWMDVDCEIRGSIGPLFEYCKHGIAVARDPYFKFSGAKEPVNSGVVAYRHESDVISEWCEITLKDREKYRDDQSILDAIRQKNPDRVPLLPREFNWLRLDGDINPKAICMHWTGGPGKKIIRAKIAGKYNREHFISDLANTFHWKEGLEIGTWKGRTFLHLLENCPSLRMTTIDLWEPQPENDGPETYVKWDHEKNERHVRDEAAQYGERAVILKGNSQEIVPSLPGNYDFAFVDGDHGSEVVEADILNVLDKIKPTGILIGHDIDWPSVKTVVDRLLPGYMIGPDNVWLIKVSDVDMKRLSSNPARMSCST